MARVLKASASFAFARYFRDKGGVYAEYFELWTLEFPEFGERHGENAGFLMKRKGGCTVVKNEPSLKGVTGHLRQLAQPFGVITVHAGGGFDFHPPDFLSRFDDDIHFGLVPVAIVVKTRRSRCI